MIIKAKFDLGVIGPCHLWAEAVYDGRTKQLELYSIVVLNILGAPFLEANLEATRRKLEAAYRMDGCSVLDRIGDYNKKGIMVYVSTS